MSHACLMSYLRSVSYVICVSESKNELDRLVLPGFSSRINYVIDQPGVRLFHSFFSEFQKMHYYYMGQTDNS